jgi:hypothetical protein
MKTIAKSATAIVLVHFVINILHGNAHDNLKIGLTAMQLLFVWIVILILPFVGAGMLWTRFWRAGALLLAIAMAGSLLFGIWNHFVVSGPDHVAHVAAGSSGTLFQTTAVLLAISEAAGTWIAFRGLRRMS